MQSQPTNLPSGEHRATLPGDLVTNDSEYLSEHCTVNRERWYCPSVPFTVGTQHQLEPSEKPSTGLEQFFGAGLRVAEHTATSANVLYPPRGMLVTSEPHIILTVGSGIVHLPGVVESAVVRESDLATRESDPASPPTSSIASPSHAESASARRAAAVAEKKEFFI